MTVKVKYKRATSWVITNNKNKVIMILIKVYTVNHK